MSKQEHLIWNQREYDIFKTKILFDEIDFFNSHNVYEVKWLGNLGKGFFGIVDKYLLTIKNPENNTSKSILIAGKRFNNKCNLKYIQEYILKSFFIKKILVERKKYTLRVFNLENETQEQKFVKIKTLFGLRKFKISLSQILFFPDFTSNRDIIKAVSVNSGDKFNISILSNGYNINLINLLDMMINDLFYLWKNGLKTSVLDIWLLLITENSKIHFNLEIIDFDKIIPITNDDNVDKIKEHYIFIFRNFFEDGMFQKETNYVVNQIDKIF